MARFASWGASNRGGVPSQDWHRTGLGISLGADLDGCVCRGDPEDHSGDVAAGARSGGCAQSVGHHCPGWMAARLDRQWIVCAYRFGAHVCRHRDDTHCTVERESPTHRTAGGAVGMGQRLARAGQSRAGHGERRRRATTTRHRRRARLSDRSARTPSARGGCACPRHRALALRLRTHALGTWAWQWRRRCARRAGAAHRRGPAPRRRDCAGSRAKRTRDPALRRGSGGCGRCVRLGKRSRARHGSRQRPKPENGRARTGGAADGQRASPAR